ncbi:hypothetical protein [Streptomyces sp. NPDC049906]|uniref:hypothetical protein n=1 Tax=Streptomyces sp. NPDC049906 TaxID=3155656 RepID=UPI00341BCCED
MSDVRRAGALARTAGAAGLCAVLLAGCGGGGGERSDGKDPATTAPTGAQGAPRGGGDPPVPGPTGFDFDPDPARVPRDRAAALALARVVAAGPEDLGRDYRRATPYESGPAAWNVLDASCTWRGGAPPRDVLASFTRRSRLPAAGGRGTLRVAATVTVHRTESSADREMAETLEEALRCPDQRLGGSERITGLMSMGAGFGDGANRTSDDTLMEGGRFLDERVGGEPAYYAWHQDRLGPVTVALVIKGAEGFEDQELRRSAAQVLVYMKARLTEALGAGA